MPAKQDFYDVLESQLQPTSPNADSSILAELMKIAGAVDSHIAATGGVMVEETGPTIRLPSWKSAILFSALYSEYFPEVLYGLFKEMKEAEDYCKEMEAMMEDAATAVPRRKPLSGPPERFN